MPIDVMAPPPQPHQTGVKLAPKKVASQNPTALIERLCTPNTNMPFTFDMQREVAFALLALKRVPDDELFARGWDALVDAIAAGCCGHYADMVSRFIFDSQTRRAKIGEKEKDLVEAQPPAKNPVGPQTVLPSGLPIPNTTVKVKGGKVVSDKFPQAVKETYFTTVTDPVTQAQTSRKLFRRIRAAEGESGVYTVSETLVAGKFGKFRICVDQDGNTWGIKEFRLTGDGKKTLPTEDDKIKHEYDTMEAVKSSLQAHEVFAVNEKVYAVVPLKGRDWHEMRQTNDLWGNPYYGTMVRRLFKDIAHDIADCHAAKKMHRDVKPENILWSNDEKPFSLADFGLAYDGLEVTDGDIAGTPGYIATEVLAAMPYVNSYNASTDIFSLGLLLAYSHADEALCPFATLQLRDQGTARYLLQTWMAKNTYYDKHGDFQFNWHEINKQQSGLDTFCLQFFNGDPGMCRFVYEFMLQTKAHKRAPADVVAAFADDLFEVEKVNESGMLKEFAYLADDPDQADMIARLQKMNALALQAERMLADEVAALKAQHKIPDITFSPPGSPADSPVPGK